MRLMMIALLMSACATAPAMDVPFEGVVLSPTPEAEAATREAAERWSAATGLSISIGEGGVPVSFVADAINPAGHRSCAHTVTSPAAGPLYVEVDGTPPEGKCRGAADTIAHELGHVLCHHYQPGASACHVEHGLMRSGARANVAEDLTINAETLEAVCAVAPCTAFLAE
jgi:hypothetical protein